MRKVFLLILTGLMCMTVAAKGDYSMRYRNQARFGDLLTLMLGTSRAGEADESKVSGLLETIEEESEADGWLARTIWENWKTLYVTPYTQNLWQGETDAGDILGEYPENGHAFVVLGYQLENGEMLPELKGRCEAAAACARRYPQSILVCSGGATGGNNPEKHTEAGMMKRYLKRDCGIDDSRIFTDERAMSTVENAVNTFRILRRKDVHNITIVSSSYHERWGQVLYHAQAALEYLRDGYEVKLIGNYSYPIEASPTFQDEAAWAVRQLAMILDLPATVRRAITQAANP